jgi:hypothetical protein
MTRKPKVHFPGRFICYGLIPEGIKITGWGAGAYQAEYMAKFWKPTPPFFYVIIHLRFWEFLIGVI